MNTGSSFIVVELMAHRVGGWVAAANKTKSKLKAGAKTVAKAAIKAVAKTAAKTAAKASTKTAKKAKPAAVKADKKKSPAKVTTKLAAKGPAGTKEKKPKAAKTSATQGKKVLGHKGVEKSSKTKKPVAQVDSEEVVTNKVPGSVPDSVIVDEIEAPTQEDVQPEEAVSPSAALLRSMKPTTNADKQGDRRKKRDDLKLDRSGDLEAQWAQIKEKYKALKPTAYKMSEVFEARTPIIHKVLGWGFIISNQNDRLEVLFQQGIKNLISNYKV